MRMAMKSSNFIIFCVIIPVLGVLIVIIMHFTIVYNIHPISSKNNKINICINQYHENIKIFRSEDYEWMKSKSENAINDVYYECIKKSIG